MTRVVILAAGFGSRLMPLTASKPKGMVEIAGESLLVRQISTLRACGIDDISIVGGYLSERLESLGCHVFLNSAYDTTNMVSSLMCAQSLLDGTQDLIVAYGDIVYEPKVLHSLLTQHGEVVLASDRYWERLWQTRMEDYLTDVESFKVDSEGRVLELGKPPTSSSEVQGQYIGLVKFSAGVHSKLNSFYENLDRLTSYDGQAFDQMYMTSFLQALIDDNWEVRSAFIENGWLEVDSVEDLHVYESLQSKDHLHSICDLDAWRGPSALLVRLASDLHSNSPGEVGVSELAMSVLAKTKFNSKALGVFDLVARKIEISGVLHDSYDIVLGKLKPVSDSASEKQVVAVFCAYLILFDRTNNPRYLNTVLKGLDTPLANGSALFADIEKFCELRLVSYG